MNGDFFDALRQHYLQKNIVAIKGNLDILFEQLLKSVFFNEHLFFHPLGFIYGKLYEFENSETFRIHIWNELSVPQQPIMDIHNHYYQVNSFVYQGIIYNHLYAICSDLPTTHRRYVGSYNGVDTRQLTQTEDFVHLALVATQEHISGSLYQIFKTEIHSGGAVSGPAISVVFSESPGVPKPLIFGPIDGEKSYVYTSNPVSNHEVELIKEQIKINFF